MGLKNYALGVLSGVALIGCAGATFPYKHYALDANSYEGFLRGESEKDDLPLAECQPTYRTQDEAKVTADAAPCIVIKTDAFLRMKLEFKDMQNRLEKCGG